MNPHNHLEGVRMPIHPHTLHRPAAFVLLMIAGMASAQSPPVPPLKPDPSVFHSAPADFTPDIFAPHAKSETLRILTLVEAVGEPRTRELVRVPLFFHENECPDPHALQILAPDSTPIPYQPDDIRLAPNGQVARMTIYFLADLAPWQRRTLRIVAGKNPGATLDPIPLTVKDNRLTIAGEDLQTNFHLAGPTAGTLASLATKTLAPQFPAGQLAPALTLVRQKPDLTITRETPLSFVPAAKQFTPTVASLRYASGPLFAKFTTRILAPAPEDCAEYSYLIPRHGTVLTQTQTLFPADPLSPDTVGAKSNALLAGKIILGDSEPDQQIISIPAGLRPRTATVFNYTNEALVNPKNKISLLMVPLVQSSGTKLVRTLDGQYRFQSPSDFQRRAGSNSESLRVFWGQARFILSSATSPADLYLLARANSQPLVAVVDEPSATPDHFSTFTRTTAAKFLDVKNWPGANDPRPLEAQIVLDYYTNNSKNIPALLAARAAEKRTLEQTVPSADALAKAWKKSSQAPGPLDPYHLSFSGLALAPLAAFIAPSPTLDEQAALLGHASLLVNGRVNQHGSPHIRSFGNSANMQIGTFLLATYGGQKTNNPALLHWALAATQNQAFAATYGRAQRPYAINIGVSEASDILYISITDFQLRTLELTCNENLQLHPAIYNRYTDSLDVNADLYQHKLLPPDEKNPKPTPLPARNRAMMFRSQSHDHRWEAFGCDPYLPMLSPFNSPAENIPGLTESCYFMQQNSIRNVTWNRLMYDTALPDILLRKALAVYKPAPRPPLPANVQLTRPNAMNTITWDPVPAENLAGYRIYRAEKPGGPWLWLNSPYRKMTDFVPPQKSPAEKLNFPTIPDTLIKSTTYEDTSGHPEHIYFITAEDTDGRESLWFPEEPAPGPTTPRRPQ